MTPEPETAAPGDQASGGFDLPRIERAVKEILLAIGEDPERDGLADTPARVARAYAEQFAGLRQHPEDVLTTVFDADHDEMVIVRDIEVYGTCEHHLVPFIGVAHIGYIPNGKVFGVSKLARLVDVHARRLQLQERLTEDISREIMESIDAKGVGVMIEARHLCMMMRGVEKQNSRTITSALRGVFRDDAKTRDEFLRLAYATR